MRGRTIAFCAGLMLIAGSALAQQGDGAAGRPRAANGSRPDAGEDQRSNLTLPEDPRGDNGFGLLYSYSGDLHPADLYQGKNGAYNGGYAYPRN